MTTPDHTHELRDPGGPDGDPAAALEVRGPGALATEQPAGAALTASAPDSVESAPVPAGGGDQDGAGGGDEPPLSHRKRRPLRTTLIVLVAIAVAAAAGLAASGSLGGNEDDKPEASKGPSATAKVQRTSLTDTQTVDGSLSYGDAATVLAQSSGGGSKPGGGSGIVTWMPEAGDTIKRGGDVYRVNQQKTPLLYGDIPFYRTMKSGDSGSDVKILERNLKALGYDGFVADSTYNYDTATAVKEWQDDLNREETGTVKPGDAVVAPGARKVSAVKAEVGAAPSGEVLTWTGTERVITVDLDAQYEDLVKNGTKAQVKLPDGTNVEATVTEVGSPSNAADEGSGDSGSGDSGSDDSDKASTLPVELKVKDQKGLGSYQAASVDVTLKSESRKNVLAVPVSALVAKDGGGYALEVVKSSAPNGVEYVPVKLGMFADSMVEVSGAGISEGTVVGVPK